MVPRWVTSLQQVPHKDKGRVWGSELGRGRAQKQKTAPEGAVLS